MSEGETRGMSTVVSVWVLCLRNCTSCAQVQESLNYLEMDDDQEGRMAPFHPEWLTTRSR